MKGKIMREKKPNGWNMKCRSNCCRYENLLTMYGNMSKVLLVGERKARFKGANKTHVT